MDISLLIIVFFLGFASHLVGALAGGGGLISLPTMLLMGIPIHSAIAIEKFGAALSSLLTTLDSVRKKEIAILDCVALIVIGLISGFTGGAVASLLDAKILNIVAIILMIFAFVMTFYSKSFSGVNEQITNKRKVYPLLSGVGFYDGIFGPGSSTLSIYVLLNDQIQYYRAVLLTRVSLFSWCCGALISYISAGHMIWSTAFTLAGGAIIGGFTGVYISKKIDIRYVKPILRVVMLIILIQVILKMF